MWGMSSDTALAAMARSGSRRVQIGSKSSGHENRTRRTGTGAGTPVSWVSWVGSGVGSGVRWIAGSGDGSGDGSGVGVAGSLTPEG